MDSRHRERKRSVAAGEVLNWPWWSPTPIVVGGPWIVDFESAVMDDYTNKKAYADGFLPASDLMSDSRQLSWRGISGSGAFTYREIPPDWMSSNNPDPIIPVGSDKGNDWYAVQLLAETNPFRPVYSVPVAIRELADIAEMFAIAAKSFAELVGGSYLNYKFGWLSFVQDVRTLYSITTAIERRMKEYASLVMLGGLKRKVRLDSYGDSIHWSSVPFHTTWAVWTSGNIDITSRTSVYGSVTWIPTSDFLIPLDGISNFNLACKQAFDLEELDGKTLWELIPFSWLIDYFIGMSNTFGATEGRGLVEPRDVCIMRHHIVRTQGTPVYAPGSPLSGGDFVINREMKLRKVVGGVDAPPVLWGFLSQSQYLVLAALLAKFS